MLTQYRTEFHTICAECKELLLNFMEEDTIHILQILTLVAILLTVGDFWYLKIPTTILSIYGIMNKSLRKTPTFWFLIVCFVVSSHYMNWYSIDNHKYLLLYWCLCLWFSTMFPDESGNFLKTNARLLLSLCIGISVVWKLSNPNYVDGSFFHFTLLTDQRFENFASIIGGLDSSSVKENIFSIKSFYNGSPEGMSFELLSSQRLDFLATFMTWWTVAIESFIAIAFALPRSKRVDLASHISLCLFCLTTYSVATVVGFGWLLIIMGITMCGNAYPRIKICYILLFGLLQLYTMPLYELYSFITGSSI